MDAITLHLDPKTLDYIANVLGQRPYAEVASVLNTIATQVQAQQPQPASPLRADPGPVGPNGKAGDPAPAPAH